MKIYFGYNDVLELIKKKIFLQTSYYVVKKDRFDREKNKRFNMDREVEDPI